MDYSDITKNNIIKKIPIFLFLFLLIFGNNIHFINAADPSGGGSIDPSSAGGTNAITQVLCNIVELLTGNIARGVAIVAIVVVAVGLFMGKFSWGVGLATAIGIAMIFGAGSVVRWLSTGIGNAGSASFCGSF
jgi:type IV secretory pathway VirB2 component (pilin)